MGNYTSRQSFCCFPPRLPPRSQHSRLQSTPRCHILHLPGVTMLRCPAASNRGHWRRGLVQHIREGSAQGDTLGDHGKDHGNIQPWTRNSLMSELHSDFSQIWLHRSYFFPRLVLWDALNNNSSFTKYSFSSCNKQIVLSDYVSSLSFPC